MCCTHIRSRQVLPIEERAGRAQTVALCLHQAELWQQDVQVMQLEENMRVERLLSSVTEQAVCDLLRGWASFLLRLGDGECTHTDPTGTEYLRLDDHVVTQNMCAPVNSESEVLEMLDWTYGDVTVFRNDWQFWSERAIVTPRHVCVDYINNLMLDRLPGNEVICTSADYLSERSPGFDVPLDFLHRQQPSGLPPHQLRLKVGAVVMLLRNLDPGRGLSNGVRMVVRSIHANRFLTCQIITGKRAGDEVLIPRIKLLPSQARTPILWVRLQFPVKVCYCMTINKSQVRRTASYRTVFGS